MKLKRLTLVAVLTFRCAFVDAAQIIAGSAEDKALQRLTAETDPEKRIALSLDFEKAFPQSKALPDVYLLLVGAYRQKNDPNKIIEYGEKALKLEPENLTALMSVARNYAIQKQQLERAVDYAERAVELAGKMRSQAPPVQYSDTQWKDYVNSNEVAAKGILQYVKSVKHE